MRQIISRIKCIFRGHDFEKVRIIPYRLYFYSVSGIVWFNYRCTRCGLETLIK